MLRAHIEERFNEEVIIKGGHVNIRSQVKIQLTSKSYSPYIIKTVTMLKKELLPAVKILSKNVTLCLMDQCIERFVQVIDSIGCFEKERLTLKGTQPLMESYFIQGPFLLNFLK